MQGYVLRTFDIDHVELACELGGVPPLGRNPRPSVYWYITDIMGGIVGQVAF